MKSSPEVKISLFETTSPSYLVSYVGIVTEYQVSLCQCVPARAGDVDCVITLDQLAPIKS